MVSFGKMAKPAAASSPETPSSFGSAQPAQKKSGLSFLKKGTAAKAAVDEAEAKAELAKAEAGRLWRFFLKDGADAQITFLDGELDDAGMLDTPVFWEHTLYTAGDVKNYVCTAEEDQTQPCPICESGDKPSLVQVFTIIDHRPHTIQRGPNAGKVIPHSIKLLVAKPGTRKLLAKIASKRGGLTGCTFDVSRTGDKSPAVGDQFDFVTKATSYEEIAAKYDLPVDLVKAADYDEEIRYIEPEELIKAGVGKAPTGVGYQKTGTGFNKTQLADQL